MNRRFLWILHWGICGWGNSLAKNYLQRNKYSKVCIAEHKHGHHDEMKTSTEYRKRKHRMKQDEDKQTEEFELRKLRKSSVKVLKHRYEQVHNTAMRKWKSWGNRTSWLGEDNDLEEQFQLLSTVVSVVHLVGAARYLNLRTHSPGHTVLIVFSLS